MKAGSEIPGIAMLIVAAAALLYSRGAAAQPETDMTVVRSAGWSDEVMTLAETPRALDGTGSEALFYQPRGIAVDANGNLFVTDNLDTIRKISPNGVVSTLAGRTGSQGDRNGTGGGARFDRCKGIAVDASGNVYVSDHYTIRKISPSGKVTTLAGAFAPRGFADGKGAEARFWSLSGLAVDPLGNLFAADTYNYRIRKIDAAGVVTTVAKLDSRPVGVAVDSKGNVFFTAGVTTGIGETPPEPLTGMILKLGRNGEVTPLLDANGQVVNFYAYLEGIAVDPSGNVYVVSPWRQVVHKVSAAGEVSTLAGFASASGSSDGMGSAARFDWPWGVAVDASGTPFVTEWSNNTVRRISPEGMVTTVAGRAGERRPVGTIGNFYVNNPPGFVGVTHQLSYQGEAGSFRWRLTRVPAGSAARLSSETAPNPTFTPDMHDVYEVQLVTPNGVGYATIAPPTLGGTTHRFKEESRTVAIDVKLSEPVPSTVNARWATSDSTATAGADYLAASGELSFAPGETAKTIEIELLDDVVDETMYGGGSYWYPIETFTIELDDATSVLESSLQVEIDSGELLPSITIGDASVTEGNDGITNAWFRVALSRPAATTVKVSYMAKGGTATTGLDYAVVGSELTFTPGQVVQYINVQVMGDSQPEPNESFSVTLSGGVPGAVIVDAEGAGTILDDDTPPRRRPARRGGS